MTRCERLRKRKSWSQYAMAEFLRVKQATVSRLESGSKESGPVSALLDRLEEDLESVATTPAPNSPVPSSPADAASGAAP